MKDLQEKKSEHKLKQKKNF
jgi:hypothetical protein